MGYSNRWRRTEHIKEPCITCGNPFESGQQIVFLKLATVDSAGSYAISPRPPLVVLHADCWTGDDPR